LLDPDQPAWRSTAASAEIAEARVINDSIITLPCFPQMTEEEISSVCYALETLGQEQ
jgi:dTDP-4-amino-4,6-dideoxygalactose transaminase